MKIYTIEKVKEYIAKARELAPDVTNAMLYSDGEIHYMNGNDGTDFDWNCNDRLCEFMVFAKNELGFIKVYVNKDDTIDGYMYVDFGMKPTHHLEVVNLNEGEAKEFAYQMYQIADAKGIYDAKISTLDFEEEVDVECGFLDTDDEW